jgi:hypothetical protein
MRSVFPGKGRPRPGIWHIGIAVPDLEEGKKELSQVFGLNWRPARVRKLTLADAAGRRCEVECHVAFSLGAPFGSEFAGEPQLSSAL